ncbi:MAG TPA: hypothetical protein VHE53_03150 [Patescibacteria group bacterium]|nr:hypothetical protein [Patescibacteria group bacterium]
MLYIIGGAARSGKSIISRRFTEDFGIPCFSIDLLITVLENAPEYKIGHGQQALPKAEKLWKFVKPLCTNLIYEVDKYLLEGDGLLPKHVAELQEEFPDKVRACFLGAVEINPNSKLEMIRKWEDLPDAAWTKRYKDEELLRVIERIRDFSIYLKDECRKYSIPYFEMHDNIDSTYEELKKLFIKS